MFGSWLWFTIRSFILKALIHDFTGDKPTEITYVSEVELVSKELNHMAAILHVYAGGLYFMK